ncbi:MAG: carbohydrate ABC transporter permease [Anaerolineae bacterium]|nr:carbohydrate ABC transporter permease [Anaerolineae bacterium]
MNTRIPVLNMTVGGFLARFVLFMIVVIWTLPTFGLLVTSLRDKDQIILTGWWTALQTIEGNSQGRTGTAEDMVEENGTYYIRGSIYEEETNKTVVSFGGGFLPSNDSVEYGAGDQVGIRDWQPGEPVPMDDGTTFTLNEDGTYEWASPDPFELERGQRFFYVEQIPPRFTLENYREVLEENGIGRAFINTFTVTVPATIIPIAIAAFASYAFAWMQFPGRKILFAIVVGLLVVPLQMSLIPLLKFYNNIGDLLPFYTAKSYPSIWLAHTGFGLPLAIYLLHNYISGLPREIIESAKIDGASHFKIFTNLILPLSVPALASFAIFQFLWVWNDLLVALVFLTKNPDQIVMTSQIRELIGSRGDNWEILTSGAFVSMAVPLLVFFALQRYFVRGLLAGSVKGG